MPSRRPDIRRTDTKANVFKILGWDRDDSQLNDRYTDWKQSAKRNWPIILKDVVPGTGRIHKHGSRLGDLQAELLKVAERKLLEDIEKKKPEETLLIARHGLIQNIVYISQRSFFSSKAGRKWSEGWKKKVAAAKRQRSLQVLGHDPDAKDSSLEIGEEPLTTSHQRRMPSQQPPPQSDERSLGLPPHAEDFRSPVIEGPLQPVTPTYIDDDFQRLAPAVIDNWIDDWINDWLEDVPAPDPFSPDNNFQTLQGPAVNNPVFPATNLHSPTNNLQTLHGPTIRNPLLPATNPHSPNPNLQTLHTPLIRSPLLPAPNPNFQPPSDPPIHNHPSALNTNHDPMISGLPNSSRFRSIEEYASLGFGYDVAADGLSDGWRYDLDWGMAFLGDPPHSSSNIFQTSPAREYVPASDGATPLRDRSDDGSIEGQIRGMNDGLTDVFDGLRDGLDEGDGFDGE